MAKTPRVVAELGRPETPEETAARKAENSRKHRANQTVINLVLALAASLAIVLLLVLVVVRPDLPAREPVDYGAIAEQAQPAVDEPLADPDLPEGWTANSATIEATPDVTEWYIGFITPSTEFIGFRQGVDADATWVSNQVDDRSSTGEVELGGLDWTIFDYRERRDVGNLAYSMVATSGDSRLVIYGSADDTEFATLATALAADLPTDDEEGDAP
ncbi:DUF4245 domain-containing protein [Marisediminicola sp. LYQ134]|uniref:DUF4245 domain-containing protein n=1 Tax=unclassified Marisediminicola TaxID=2618316 RepID=UPI003983A947